ncbi:hypothetical protein [Kitasatospora sp. NPDC050463]|uniref:hypothetical protein n=1 Tax=Kitasatospora sp. NPDC050463 TaxID=3155786 RepID=UPI0033D27EBC
MDEISRAEWFAIGVAGLALAGAAHAVAGTAHIARAAVRPSAAPNGDGAPGVEVDSGPGGWILFGALVLASGAVYRVVADTGEVVKEILNVAARPAI